MDIRQLRKKIDEGLKRPLTDQEWDGYRPDYPAPYGKADFKEILRVLPKGLRSEMRGMGSLPPGGLIPDGFTVTLRDTIPSIRALLGLTEPIGLEDLETVLSRFRDSTKRSLLTLPYPVRMQRGRGIALYEVRAIRVSQNDQRVAKFMYYINGIAGLSRCHPALVLGYCLCEMPVYLNDVRVLIEDNRFTIQLRRGDVPARRLIEAYSDGRDFVGATLRKPTRNPPHRTHDRVFALNSFIEDNPNLGWNERLKQWNSLYPKWEYASANSMKVVWSRTRDGQKKAYEDDFTLTKEILGMNPFMFYYRREFQKEGGKFT